MVYYPRQQHAVERQINTYKQTVLHQNEIKRMKKLIVASLALLVAGAVSVRAADAKELWEKNCAKCHGVDGAGKTKMGEKLGVKDYTDAKVQESLKDAEMTKAIKEGVKEKDSDKTKMKAFSDLSDDEVKALVAQVRSFKK
jgi:mono/diheme cytochrome c family protein